MRVIPLEYLRILFRGGDFGGIAAATAAGVVDVVCEGEEAPLFLLMLNS